MSLYAEYIAERNGDQIIETSDGFATYRYLDEGKAVYLVDIYVAPHARNSRHWRFLVDCVVAKAKGRGCTELLGTIVPSTQGATRSMKIVLTYGMTIKSALADMIIVRKDL